MTHICVGNLTFIGSDNGLSPSRRQAITWTNAELLLIGPLGTNCEILMEIYTFSFSKMLFKMSSRKWRQFCLGLNVLMRACLCKQEEDIEYLHVSERRRRDHSVYAPSQWETTLQFNAIFHCLGAYTEGSPKFTPFEPYRLWNSKAV